ncbi:MAG: histidine phosphatase family protein [Candidatus Peregrinibacteria bacterium]|nr:histidine phosphatase family protein [Candidatus Peregrinibacteria bacterium]MDZ4245307.1 histidine phosphatase family protein [Candidatus Gracilibacteria bacterium]
MKIILVRHGQTFENVSGVMQGQDELLGRLTPLGVAQAEKLAERLASEKIDMIFSSDLNRAVKTAGAISQFHDVPFYVTSDLRERNYGALTGCLKEKLFEEIDSAGLTEVSLRPLDGENYHDVRIRGQKFLNRLLKEYPSKTVLMVAHGGYNRAFLSAALNVPLDEMFSISQGNTCVNIIEFDENGIGKEVLIDCTVHLD